MQYFEFIILFLKQLFLYHNFYLIIGYDRGRSGSRREYGSSGFRDSFGDRDRGGFDRDRSGRFDSSGGFDRDRRMGDRDYGRSGFGAPRRGYDREFERDGYRRSDGPPSGEYIFINILLPPF